MAPPGTVTRSRTETARVGADRRDGGASRALTRVDRAGLGLSLHLRCSVHSTCMGQPLALSACTRLDILPCRSGNTGLINRGFQSFSRRNTVSCPGSPSPAVSKGGVAAARCTYTWLDACIRPGMRENGTGLLVKPQSEVAPTLNPSGKNLLAVNRDAGVV
jgi:hypothetical protein